MKLTLLHGDICDKIKELPENSVDLCLTSPPYWGLRDYSVEGQLGAEPTMEAYLDNLLRWTKEVYRVLKPTGSFVLNLGDCFTGGGMKVKCTNAITPERYECPDAVKTEGHIYKAKQLLSVSSFAYCRIISETDFVCRGEHIWAKPNVPSPIRSRLKHSHEKLFWFVKDADKYYFDSKAWMKKLKSSDLRAVNYSNGEDYTNRKPSRSIQETGVRTNEDTIEHSWRIVAVGQKQNGFEMEEKKPTAEHVAPFPTTLIKPYILSLCPQGGTVLDPFLGSGTTMRVAMENNRNAIGIELNPEYAEYAKKRVNWGAGLGVEYEEKRD